VKVSIELSLVELNRDKNRPRGSWRKCNGDRQSDNYYW